MGTDDGLWPAAGQGAGRYPCEKTSASRTRPRRISTSHGVRRSSSADSLPCPVPRVPFLVPKVGQMRGCDLQDVGTVLGEGAGACRPGEHARVIDDANVSERSVARWQRLGGHGGSTRFSA
jgi:hypothetical protein